MHHVLGCLERCFRMAAVHDMAEAIVGDITPSDGISLDAKYKLELVSTWPEQGNRRDFDCIA
jgi:hypothetical protein